MPALPNSPAGTLWHPWTQAEFSKWRPFMPSLQGYSDDAAGFQSWQNKPRVTPGNVISLGWGPLAASSATGTAVTSQTGQATQNAPTPGLAPQAQAPTAASAILPSPAAPQIGTPPTMPSAPALNAITPYGARGRNASMALNRSNHASRMLFGRRPF